LTSRGERGGLIEPLGAHDRSAFSCGASLLDRYLREQATQDIKRLLASCLVLVEKSTNTLAGYYTLSASSICASDLPAETSKRLPRYPVFPAALIGRLAIDQKFQRRGLASALLAEAAKRALKGDAKAFALIVDAKDENAVAFYRLQGFRPFASRPMSLFLPLGTAKKGSEAELLH
jgi:GNAT superfamily N-acetyltransferase